MIVIKIDAKEVYSVVKKEYENYLPFFLRINTLQKTSKKEKLLIAIEGNSGSGKSRLAKQIQDLFNCNVFHTDDFFLRKEQRTKTRLEEPGGNIDYERLYKELLQPLCLQKDFSFQRFDCSIMDLGERIHVSKKRLNILEGVYSQHPYFGDSFDLKFFLTVSKEIQYKRILKRNGKELLKHFESQWIPMENKYFKEFHIAEQCEEVIHTDLFFKL